MKSPQNYKLISEAMQNNGNPQALVQQMMGSMSNEQKGALLKQAKGYGCPEEILSQLQNMK